MKNPVTSITGIALALLSIASFAGWISPGDQTTLGEYVTATIAGIAGIISVLSGDPGKTESGA